MKTAVVVFPGSNCDRDMAVALRRATGADPAMVWHKETSLPAGVDLVALPGGFSYGDYLRPGAIAARAPILRAVAEHAGRGGLVLGVCNGFQILLEAGLLPGALLRNAGRLFRCRDVVLETVSRLSPFTGAAPATIACPIAHHDGAYVATDEVLARLRGEERIAFRYVDGTAVNGSVDGIAGVLSENGRVLGMMPHPERAADPALGSDDGAALFAGLAAGVS